MRFAVTGTLVLATLGSGACGTSQVFTDEPTARIWANGQLIGRGHGEIQQRGTPETISILVRAEDGREQVTSVKRRITGVTVLGALLTYGTCLIFCWEYPDSIWAPLPERAGTSAWRGTADAWLTPPTGWQPRQASAAVSTDAAEKVAIPHPTAGAPAAQPKPAPDPAGAASPSAQPPRLRW